MRITLSTLCRNAYKHAWTNHNANAVVVADFFITQHFIIYMHTHTQAILFLATFSFIILANKWFAFSFIYVTHIDTLPYCPSKKSLENHRKTNCFKMKKKTLIEFYCGRFHQLVQFLELLMCGVLIVWCDRPTDKIIFNSKRQQSTRSWRLF